MATGLTSDNTSQGFRVESLLHNLKELQNGKQCLEQKLNSQRNARRSLENTVEMGEIDIGVTAKCAQVKDVHQKMSETLKVAQNKVAQTQAHSQSLEETNQRRRQKIVELNKLIEDEKEKHLQEVHKFQDSLSAASAYLMKSKTAYSEDNLVDELQKLQTRKADLQNKVEGCSIKITELNGQIENLTNACDKGDQYLKDIPIDQRKIVL